MSKRVIARHVGQNGYVCPRYQRDPHPARDLTVDHVVLGGEVATVFRADEAGAGNPSSRSQSPRA